MHRLQTIQNQLSYVDDGVLFYRLKELLKPEEDQLRVQTRQMLEEKIAPFINDYVEKAEFPEVFLQHLRTVPFDSASSVGRGLVIAEMARIDGGLATFYAVHKAVVTYTFEAFGSEEQKNHYLPKLSNFELIGGWGLTERDQGSDASNVQTTARPQGKGYVLNGNKRWIGSANRNFLVVWAKDTQSKKINGYIVQNGTPGFRVNVIKNKLPVRIVQNCDIELDNVYTEEQLPGAYDFQSVSTKVLAHSRCFICWIAVGICLGVYDNVSKYMQKRTQFQVPIASFQLQQERLVRIQATTNAVFLIVHRLTQMWDQGKAGIGVIAATKAWVSERTREVAKLGREIMGGNGILTDNYCIKAVNDIEAMYTYEGTYDINSLIAGRELTGIAAFKVK